MSFGANVRHLFGPYEKQVADLYRSVYIDLDDWARKLSAWVPQASRILEVGCGEGAMTERLAQLYPQARITAIDVTPRLGRLYDGDRSRVEFLQAPVQAIAETRPQSFDLVLLSDVIHHVPVPLRSSILDAVRGSMSPGGTFVFKDWMRAATPIHWACEASDRYLTGDDVVYLDPREMRALLERSFGTGVIRDEITVAPWRNNLALRIVAPPAASTLISAA